VETLQEPFALLDEKLRLVSASSAFFLRFSLDSELAVGAPVYEWGAGEWETPAVRELFEVVAPGRDSVEGFVLELPAFGSRGPKVSASLRPLRQGKNTIIGYLLGISEVAAPPESAASELVERLRRRSGDIALIVDTVTWRIVAADEAACNLTGFPPGELKGLPLDSVLHATDRQSVLSSLQGLLNGEIDLRMTFRLRQRDGRFIWLDAVCHTDLEQSETPLIHVVARDVSEQKRAEEALRWLGRQTKLILDSAADGIFGVDPSGLITFINPVAARNLKYRVAELLSRKYKIFFGPEDDGTDINPLIDVVAETLRDGLDRRIREYTFRCSDGRTLPVELSCSGSREHGEITGAVVTFRDVTERKLAESAARRADWLSGVGETTVAIRHEINNPLTTLLAEVRLLEMGGNTPDEEREMIGGICEQARRIANVIRRLTEQQDSPVVKIEGSQRMLDLSVDRGERCASAIYGLHG
jgi:PAS domain S-box-containing protein